MLAQCCCFSKENKQAFYRQRDPRQSAGKGRDMSRRFTLRNRITIAHHAGFWRATFVVLPATLLVLTVTASAF